MPPKQKIIKKKPMSKDVKVEPQKSRKRKYNEEDDNTDYLPDKKVKLKTESSKITEAVEKKELNTNKKFTIKVKDEFKVKNIPVKSEIETEANSSEDTADVHFKKPTISTNYVDNKFKNQAESLEGTPAWKDFELISELTGVNLNISKTIVRMFEDGSTIPFIARYRKDLTGNMDPDGLRNVKECYDKVLSIKARCQAVLKSLETSNNLTKELKNSIVNAKSLEEIEHMYLPFKSAGKKTLFERAKRLGLVESAQQMLNSRNPVDLTKLIDRNNIELDDEEKVEQGIIHVIAHLISTDVRVLSFIRNLRASVNFGLEVKKRNSKTEDLDSEKKYENYYDFFVAVKHVKPHQVLAINRAEHQKVVSVKIKMPEFVFKELSSYCWNLWSVNIKSDQLKSRIFNESIKDCYKRLIQPLIVREIRSELKANAEQASYNVFCDNLKQLLLTTPVKGRPILGIDPGYKHGCKVAVISGNGSLLQSDVLYITDNKNNKFAELLKKMLLTYKCSLIALGNGTACRETELKISDLIAKNYFQPLDVEYTIINENGVSIYSCGDEAKREFPNLDPNIISAVSIARRVQEPLGEYVKVEPKHVGVGMYQHDLPKKQLEEALNSVVTECVSFVGVDLNTASQCLLRRVAGLSDKKATTITEYREKNGTFFSRKELLKIKGIGKKSYEQCVGFLRVCPLNSESEREFYSNKETNKLDCTIIHPESYELASGILKEFKLNSVDIGKKRFIDEITKRTSDLNIKVLCEKYETTEETLKLILDVLAKPLDYDLRNDRSKTPLFKRGVTNINDLHIGTILTGNVTNNTHFGSFVDVGVGTNGLVHTSKLKGYNLQIGNVVEVKVNNLDIQRKRIGLELIRLT